MSLVDPTPHRVSSCPVHFIWDGKGKGRTLVRVGFLGALLAFGLAMLAQMAHVDAARVLALGLALAASLSWGAGHLLGLPRFNARLTDPRAARPR